MLFEVELRASPKPRQHGCSEAASAATQSSSPKAIKLTIRFIEERPKNRFLLIIVFRRERNAFSMTPTKQSKSLANLFLGMATKTKR
jgi:hypothetical protein